MSPGVIRAALVAGLVLALLAALALAVAWQRYERFLATPLAVPAEGVLWRLEAGRSYDAMVAELNARGFTRADWRWWLLGRLDPRPQRLQAGEYALEPGLTPLALLDRLARGEVYLHAFTIVEGWTVARLRQALAEAPGVTRSGTVDTDAALREALAIATESVEGWFLPETYRYPSGTTDRTLLAQAHAAMRAALDEAWEAQAPGLPYGERYDVLIMASIVEKETGRAAERPAIAGVFVRRLARGMRLQADPTVIYGLGVAFDGDLRRRDLEADTPWNTYTRAGLPATPIALPGRAAIEAAVRPAAGDALYFVARGDGSHVFSATLAEHEAAVDAFQRGGR